MKRSAIGRKYAYTGKGRIRFIGLQAKRAREQRMRRKRGKLFFGVRATRAEIRRMFG